MWRWLRLFARDRARPDTVVWAAGDIAECVVGGAWFHDEQFQPGGPRPGDRAMVLDVAAIAIGVVGLRLIGWGPQHFEAAAFRKITPTDVEELFVAHGLPTPAPGDHPLVLPDRG